MGCVCMCTRIYACAPAYEKPYLSGKSYGIIIAITVTAYPEDAFMSLSHSRIV